MFCVSKAKCGTGGSGVRHSFPTRELEEGDPVQSMRGWALLDLEDRSQGEAGISGWGRGKSHEAPEDHEGTPRCGRAEDSNR